MNITVKLSDDEEKVLTKRAKKNMMSLTEQVQDIIRRSCVNQISKSELPKDDIDDKLVSIFSRRKRAKKK